MRFAFCTWALLDRSWSSKIGGALNLTNLLAASPYMIYIFFQSPRMSGFLVVTENVLVQANRTAAASCGTRKVVRFSR